MAELAAGAVSSLLFVIRSEALLLRGVRDDVQFIKEEMESMKSFLAHLARWVPAGGEHDEQVRTWMNQVRLLAQDCNNCIDLYLYRGNPDIHRARGGLRGYLWWATWLVHKLVAQQRAAGQLRLLKERARDVGERRLRYGVEVPDKPGKGQSPPTALSSSSRAAAAAGDDDEEEEEDSDDQLMGVIAPGGHSARRAFIEPPTLDDYVSAKLWEWIDEVPAYAGETLSMVVVAPDTYQDLLALVQELWIFEQNPEGGYDRTVVVDIPAVHHYSAPLRSKEVLFYILRELNHAKSNFQEQGTQGQVDLDPWEVYLISRSQIHHEKKRAIAPFQIEENIEEMKIYEKLDRIKSDIQGRLEKGTKLGTELEGDSEQLDLDVLLQLLLEKAVSQEDQKGKNKLPALDDDNIIVKKLKEHMEADEKKNLEEREAVKHMGAEEGEDAVTKHMEGGGEVARHVEEDMEEGGGEVSIRSVMVGARQELGVAQDGDRRTTVGAGGGNTHEGAEGWITNRRKNTKVQIREGSITS